MEPVAKSKPSKAEKLEQTAKQSELAAEPSKAEEHQPNEPTAEKAAQAEPKDDAVMEETDSETDRCTKNDAAKKPQEKNQRPRPRLKKRRMKPKNLKKIRLGVLFIVQDIFSHQ